MQKVFFTFFIAFVAAVAWADDDIKCNPNGNQLEMNACAFDVFAEADAELNRVYQALIKSRVDDKLYIGKLRLAQRAWLAFRDAELEAEFACEEGDPRRCFGSIYPSEFSLRKAELTRERTIQLGGRGK